MNHQPAFFVLLIGSAVFGIKSIIKKDFKKLTLCIVLLAAAVTGLFLGTTENLMRPRYVENNINEAALKILSKHGEGYYSYSVDGYEGNFYIYKKDEDTTENKAEDITENQFDVWEAISIDEDYLQRLIDHIGFDTEIMNLINAHEEYHEKSISKKNADTYYNLDPVALSRTDEYFGLPLDSGGTFTFSNSGYIVRIEYTYKYPKAVERLVGPLVSPALFYRERIDIMKIADVDALKLKDPYYKEAK